MGWRGRGGGWTGPWPGRGPFSNLPPWQRPRWLYGYAKGLGYSAGFGYGYGGAQYNPYVCQRFPWLPRWWWANPQTYGYPAPYPATQKPTETAGPGEGEPVSPPFIGVTPFWGPAPTPEQEKQFLEEQIKALETQIDATRKRLEELKGGQ